MIVSLMYDVSLEYVTSQRESALYGMGICEPKYHIRSTISLRQVEGLMYMCLVLDIDII